MDANRYATKKTIAQGMLDIALLTANASQLKYILQVGHKHEFYSLMLTLISVSIIMQVCNAILIAPKNALRRPKFVIIFAYETRLIDMLHRFSFFSINSLQVINIIPLTSAGFFRNFKPIIQPNERLPTSSCRVS